MKKFLKIYINVITISIMIQNVVFANDAAGHISSAMGTFIGVASYIGYAISFGMVFWIGAKYALSAASDRANLKQGVINYLIGAVLIFGASLIANTVSSIAMGGGGSSDVMGGLVNGIIGTTGTGE